MKKLSLKLLVLGCFLGLAVWARDSIATPSGDVNGDGSVNVFDALLTLQYSVGLYHPPNEAGFKSTADVAPLDAIGMPLGDNQVNVFDALAILRHAVGLDRWSFISTVYSSANVLPTTGGLLTIKSDLDEVNGASVDIPARAVAKATTFSFGVVDSLPAGSPFGQVPVGKLFGIEPAGTVFAEDVDLNLPIPPSNINMNYYIGHWNVTANKWDNLGGTIIGDTLSTKIKNLSIFGVFYAGKSDVRIVNNAGPTADLGITLLYISGPAIPPDANLNEYFPGYRPLPEKGIDLKDGEWWTLSLLPGRYHFLVTYPHPQPGVANSLFFTVPVISQGTDDGQIDQTITITLNGATSTNSYTSGTISFAGNKVVSGSNLRPIIACTAVAPAGVPVIDAVTGQAPQPDPHKANPTRIVDVGPINIEQLYPKGALTLNGQAHDPENAFINFYWTLSEGALPIHEQVPSDTTVSEGFLPNPPRGQRYNAYLTAYDPYGLFDECRWNINVRVNTKPRIITVADDVVIDFGRLDAQRRIFGPQPAVDAVPFSGSAGAPPIERKGLITKNPFGNLCAYVQQETTTYLDTLPFGDSVKPDQYPWGMTCVYAIIGDTNGDSLKAGFRIPAPIMGRGTLYAAIPVPTASEGGSVIVLVDDAPRNAPKTVADILPDGLVAGSILDTYDKIAAYNATLTYLANLGSLPVTAPLLTYEPIQPLPDWPPTPVRGPQALPVIWEAPDDPDPAGETHDCVTHRFEISYDPLCQIRTGGTTAIEGWVTDTFSPIQRGFATVMFPDAYAGNILELIGPKGDINTNQPTYTWFALPTTTDYQLWVNDSSGTLVISKLYTALEAGCAAGTGYCTVTPATSLANGNATWWVAARNSLGFGSWSEVMDFAVYTGEKPAAPTTISPKGTINTRQPTYTWNAASTATYYQLLVDDSSGKGVINKLYSASEAGCSAGTGTCTVTPSTNLAIGNATWWVAGWNTAGWGPWSAATGFTVNASAPKFYIYNGTNCGDTLFLAKEGSLAGMKMCSVTGCGTNCTTEVQFSAPLAGPYDDLSAAQKALCSFLSGKHYDSMVHWGAWVKWGGKDYRCFDSSCSAALGSYCPNLPLY